MEQTLFDIPNSSEQFSILLPPSELRKIDFSALEFTTARKAVIEYIKTYFPDDFNDFSANNGIMMLVELLSYLTAVLSMRGDMLANEAFLPTAISEDAVINHLALIGQRIKRATPATTDIECSVSNPVSADVNISPGRVFTIQGENGPIYYEIFKSPNDLISNIVIPSGKRSVIAYAVEGKTESVSIDSDGSSNQSIIVNSTVNIIDNPISINISLNNITETWNRVDIIESAGPNDKVYEVKFFEDRAEFVFGNNINGAVPESGSIINIKYRVGGGLSGRIGAGVIDETRPITPDFPYTSSVNVRFRNIVPSVGGMNRETLEQAKRRGPKNFAVHDSIVTGDDYATIAETFTHPVFGSITKAIASIRTGYNANIVDLYVLSDGADGPAVASAGLKRVFKEYINERNIITDTVNILDASIKTVDIKITVVMNKNADASIIRDKVNSLIDDFFNIRNWDLGQPLYISQINKLLTAVDGIKYIDIFNPVDNILPTNTIDSGNDNGIDINQLITLGSREASFYYES